MSGNIARMKGSGKQVYHTSEIEEISEGEAMWSCRSGVWVILGVTEEAMFDF